MKICPHCDAQLDDDLLFCIKCGTKLPIEVASANPNDSEFQPMLCPSCNITFQNGSLFCNMCGTKLEPVPEPEPVMLYKQCPGCKKQFHDESIYCNMCGIKLLEVYDEGSPKENQVLFCPKCVKEYDDDSIFCTECGSKLEFRSKKEVQEALNTPTFRYHCSACGATIGSEMGTCPKCGKDLNSINVLERRILDKGRLPCHTVKSAASRSTEILNTVPNAASP